MLVVRMGNGGLKDVEAVIDKDRTAALPAREPGADHLLILTDVTAIFNRSGRICPQMGS